MSTNTTLNSDGASRREFKTNNPNELTIDNSVLMLIRLRHRFSGRVRTQGWTAAKYCASAATLSAKVLPVDVADADRTLTNRPTTAGISR